MPQNNPFDFCKQLQKLLGRIWESSPSHTTICKEQGTREFHRIYKHLVQAKVWLNSYHLKFCVKEGKQFLRVVFKCLNQSRLSACPSLIYKSIPLTMGK